MKTINQQLGPLLLTADRLMSTQRLKLLTVHTYHYITGCETFLPGCKLFAVLVIFHINHHYNQMNWSKMMSPRMNLEKVGLVHQLFTSGTLIGPKLSLMAGSFMLPTAILPAFHVIVSGAGNRNKTPKKNERNYMGIFIHPRNE